MEIYGGCIMVSNNKKMQEVTNFLQQHQHDADVNIAFSEAKELIASEMLNAEKKEFFRNLSIAEMCEEWAVARYLAHFSCVEGAMEKLFNYERTLVLLIIKQSKKCWKEGKTYGQHKGIRQSLKRRLDCGRF